MHLSPWRPLLAWAALLLLLGACGGGQTIRQPAGYQQLQGQTVLFLSPQAFSTRDKALQADLLRQVETQTARIPQLQGRLITRARFLHKHAANPQLLDAYQEFSLLLGSAFLPNLELGRQLGQASGAGLLLSVQAETIPCSACDLGDQVWLVGQLVSATSGEILLRALYFRPYDSQGGPQAPTRAMAAEWLTLLGHALRPKWHRQRFTNLQFLIRGGAAPSSP